MSIFEWFGGDMISRGPLRPVAAASQPADQVFLAHVMPAAHASLACHGGELFTGISEKPFCTHMRYLRRSPPVTRDAPRVRADHPGPNLKAPGFMPGADPAAGSKGRQGKAARRWLGNRARPLGRRPDASL